MDENKKTIEVNLTDPTEFHCFQIVFQVKHGPDGFTATAVKDADARIPVEIYLHTVQVIDLFCQLATKLSEYMHFASGELLEIRERIRQGEKVNLSGVMVKGRT